MNLQCHFPLPIDNPYKMRSAAHFGFLKGSNSFGSLALLLELSFLVKMREMNEKPLEQTSSKI